jgi:hypothetical protein
LMPKFSYFIHVFRQSAVPPTALDVPRPTMNLFQMALQPLQSVTLRLFHVRTLRAE